MADVTDPAFRKIIAECGAPDVFWTEFVSADGLYHTREKEKIKDTENPLMRDLVFGKNENPIVAQVFTSNPEHMEYVAWLITTLGFDGIDINMGCPHKPIEAQGAGAKLIQHPELARELIRAAKKGTKNKIPVSVKTRIGYASVTLDTWLPELLAEKPSAITIHARTRKEMSKVPARWEYVREAVRMRDELTAKKEVLIIGNGDVTSKDEAYQKAREYGADGVMIGRGIFGNPWFFSDAKPSIEDKLNTLVRQCNYFETYCGHKSFAVMKKHFKAYVEGFPGAKDLRVQLMSVETAKDVAVHINRFMKNKV